MAKVGASPGTLTHVGRQYVEAVQVDAHRYGPNRSEEYSADVSALPDASEGVVWVNVTKVLDPDVMRKIGAAYGIPELHLEDVMNTTQRAKFEEDERGGFLVLRMLRWIDGQLDDEQVSLWWQKGVLVCFQEKPEDLFDPVRERIRGGKGRIRRMGADYLAYAIMDALVDHLFPVLGRLGDRIDTLEEEILAEWQAVDLARLHAVRTDLTRLRRAAWPMRDAVAGLMRAGESAASKQVHPFLRDVHDHIVQALEALDQQREAVAALRDLWTNSQAQHMNRVMQTLTVIATIFIPLTFLAGIYGMNFQHMPELSKRWAYPAFWAIIAVTTVALVAWFRRKGWIGPA